MNTSIQNINYRASGDSVQQQSWAQREIDAIIECAQHLFVDLPVRSVEVVDTVRCEGGEPAWYRPMFRSERTNPDLMDTLQARLKGVVEDLSTRFGQCAATDDHHVAFLKECLAHGAQPRVVRQTLQSKLRVGLYAAKLIARRLAA